VGEPEHVLGGDEDELGRRHLRCERRAIDQEGADLVADPPSSVGLLSEPRLGVSLGVLEDLTSPRGDLGRMLPPWRGRLLEVAFERGRQPFGDHVLQRALRGLHTTSAREMMKLVEQTRTNESANRRENIAIGVEREADVAWKTGGPTLAGLWYHVFAEADDERQAWRQSFERCPRISERRIGHLLEVGFLRRREPASSRRLFDGDGMSVTSGEREAKLHADRGGSGERVHARSRSTRDSQARSLEGPRRVEDARGGPTGRVDRLGPDCAKAAMLRVEKQRPVLSHPAQSSSVEMILDFTTR